VNLFPNLSFAKSHDEEIVEPTEEELKAERIEFHRAKVRNGPAKFSFMTNGQIRRARARDTKRQQKKAFRAEVRNYFEQQRLASMVRAHLQAAGYLAYIDGSEAPLVTQIGSTGWIVQRFGQEVEVDGVGTGHVSYRKAAVIDAFHRAADYYAKATGHPIRNDSFVPAIMLAEDEDVEGAA
jgi:hypothetical protein